MIEAKVKFAAGAPKDTKNGPRINALVTLPNGTEERIWDKPGGPVSTWQKGQTVYLEQSGQYYNVAKEQPAAQAPSAPKPGAASFPVTDQPATLDALLPKANLYADLYREILRRLESGDPDDPTDVLVIPEELRGQAAATIFISLTKNG